MTSNTVHQALDVRRQAMRILSGQDVPSHLLDMAATVEITGPATHRLAKMRSDLPAEAIEFPTNARWPWPEQPVLFIYESPVELEFFITSSSQSGGRRQPTVYEDRQVVTAHLVLPPGAVPLVVFNLDGSEADPDDPKIQADAVSRTIAVHPDGELSVGVLPWGGSLRPHPHHEHKPAPEADRQLQALARAPQAGALLVETPHRPRSERRLIQATGSSFQRLVVPTIGSVRPSKTAPVFKSRDHFTKFGEPKRALTEDDAKFICIVNEGLRPYRCGFCRSFHVGHPRGAS